MGSPPKRSFSQRMMGAALLESDVYEEVEADTRATGQAALVVGLVALAAAAGGARDGAEAAIVWVFAAFLGWLLWSGVTYLIGDRIFGGTATWGELLRTIGFAQSPGLLYMFGVVPFIGWLVTGVVGVWMLLAAVIAIRQALDFDTTRAILTAVTGFVPYVILRELTRWFLEIGAVVV